MTSQRQVWFELKKQGSFLFSLFLAQSKAPNKASDYAANDLKNEM